MSTRLVSVVLEVMFVALGTTSVTLGVFGLNMLLMLSLLIIFVADYNF